MAPKIYYADRYYEWPKLDLLSLLFGTSLSNHQPRYSMLTKSRRLAPLPIPRRHQNPHRCRQLLQLPHQSRLPCPPGAIRAWSPHAVWHRRLGPRQRCRCWVFDAGDYAPGLVLWCYGGGGDLLVCEPQLHCGGIGTADSAGRGKSAHLQ